ncbi:hypothetical protein Bca52824_081338 [Brassica carinata]|uniref:Uncharacterized protein n=1 Tax=Brassica carinata TaxID=52824 RepID=A0A8X7PIA2_BRACI|nr:hypothetical protein Bca52824_081338 [Brassica carinata]
MPEHDPVPLPTEDLEHHRPVLESGDRDRLWEFRLLASVERKQRDDGVDGGICKEAIPGAAGETKGF